MGLPTLTDEQIAWNRLPIDQQQKTPYPSTPTTPAAPKPPSQADQTTIMTPPVAPPTTGTVVNNITSPGINSGNQYDFTKTPAQNGVVTGGGGGGGVTNTLPVTGATAPSVNQVVSSGGGGGGGGTSNQVVSNPLRQAADVYSPDPNYQNILDELSRFRREYSNYVNQSSAQNADYANSVQGQISGILNEVKNFRGQFSDEISQLMKDLEQFNYNAEQDSMLQDAIKYADKSMMEELNRRGLASSTITGDNMVNIRKELMPKYQNLALERYNANIDRMLRQAEFMNKIDQQDLTRFTNYATMAVSRLEKVEANTIKSFEKIIDSISTQLKDMETAKKDKSTAYRDIYAKALDALDKFGYVTNEIAPILGLPVGTPSSTAFELGQTRLEDANKAKKQHEYRLAEIDRTAENAKKNLKETAQEKAEEAKTKDTQKANVGYYLSQLSGLSAEEALKKINKPENSQIILNAAGGDGYTEIVKALEARKQKEIDNTQQDKRLSMTIDSQNRASAASERAAIAAERTAKNQEKSDLKDEAKPFVEELKSVFEEELSKGEKFNAISKIEKWSNQGVDERVIEEVARQMNIQQGDMNDYAIMKKLNENSVLKNPKSFMPF
jgi:hypothetical protein